MDCLVGLSDPCTLLEAMRALPSVRCVSPVSMRKVVVFPAPFTPRRPKHCVCVCMCVCFTSSVVSYTRHGLACTRTVVCLYTRASGGFIQQR